MKIEKSNNEILVKFPTEKERVNPYMPDEDVGTYPTLTGVVLESEERWGLAETVDMDYKGKPDQFSKIIVDCSEMEREDFINRCMDLEIPVIHTEV